MKKKKTAPMKRAVPRSGEASPAASASSSPDRPVEPPPETGAFSLGQAGFPIVGIGASAGGLAALEAFFSGMPTDADPGMAFVIVQHLAPDHKSLLVELISRYTRMPVYEVEDGMAVRPNCAYIIPPNRDMALRNGALQLLEQTSPRGIRLPIDFFFRSLARDQRERAIGVVLSGTGSDGALGVRAIKGEGGMAMAQNPESAEFDGMPRSAIATGLMDYELPPAEMPAQLMAFATHAFGDRCRAAIATTPRFENALEKIFFLLRARTGHDFSRYKPGTIHRRVERRLAVQQIETIDGYVKYLQQTPAEVEALFRDLLIGVTSFFRDPGAFKELEEQVIPKLFAGKPAGAAIRVWSPGCATGEEAYSLAILLQERMEAMKQTFMVQVFATDIDSRAVAIARAGAYPASIAADVTPGRLDRFFHKDPDGDLYRIRKGIRDLMVFSEQDVIMDPPFSKLDLISCRNLLIYMAGELQKKLIPLFHYALNPGGALFLGPSETVGEFADLFTPLNRKWKLYQRKADVEGRHRPPEMGRYAPARTAGGAAPRSSTAAQGARALTLRELAEQVLLHEYAPASMIVNERGDILYIHGRTGRYLEPVPGDAKMNIAGMAREELRRELAAALRKAAAGKGPVRCSGLRVKTDGDFIAVNLTVRLLAAAPGPEETAAPVLFLVSFEDAPAALPDRPGQAEGPGVGAAASPADADARVAALEQELRAKEEDLRDTIDEMEISGEELKSSNEEMQSMNEELQSSNEELMTSKEELQSVNEELETVNAELQQKALSLSRANNDMNNLLAGTGVGTVFVDHRLCIRHFTPAATRVINLIPTDVGRPVGHIVTNLVGYDRLPEDVRAVLDTLTSKELEVRTQAGDWHLLRIQPYRTLENAVEGAVLTFTEITALKAAQAQILMQVQTALREAEKARRLAVVVRDAFDAVMVLDLDGRILSWNPAAERMYGWSEAEALAMNIRDLIPEGQHEEALTVAQKLSRADLPAPCRSRRVAKDGRIVEIRLTATVLLNEAGEIYAIATTEREAVKTD